MATKKTKTQLASEQRAEALKRIIDFLVEEGEDARLVAGNSIMFPSQDAEGNENFVKITVSIPRGSRLDNEAYDGYSDAEQYQEKQAEKAAKEEERKKKAAQQAEERERKLEERRKKKALEAMKKQLENEEKGE